MQLLKIKMFLFLLVFALAITTCKKPKVEPAPPVSSAKTFGWTGNDNPLIVPKFLSTFGNNTPSPTTTVLPSAYDLSLYLPPVGNQGGYGTCVAWAVAYNAKTASEAIAFGYTTAQLQMPQKQLSPKDLYTSIPNNKKDNGTASCEGGTNISFALDQLLSRGVATLATVPYTIPFDCSASNIQPAWTTDASNHKIKYYRRINQDLVTIKKCIANKIPIMFGATLTTNFNDFPSGSVLSSGIPKPKGGHAMAIVGYDNAKGANGAFKIVNSWAANWCENGFIWIDYNFFLNSFLQTGNLYVLANNETIGGSTNAGVDLAPWVFGDVANAINSTQRTIQFNIYNIGSAAATPAANWEFHYIYYNAFDANDYGIIFTDKFNTSVATNTFSCTGSVNCSFNYNIPPGGDFGNTVFGNSVITRNYNMPTLNGSYYLVMLADATGKINEQNEQNNLFYTSSQAPKVFTNGYAARANATTIDAFVNKTLPTKNNLENNNFNSAVNINNLNAYSPEEIMQFIKDKKASGELDNKINNR